MNAFSHRSVPLLVAALLAMPLALAGCKKDRLARVDPYDTTRAEEQDRRILPVALLEFSDQAPAQLLQDLQRVPEVREDERSRVLIGDLSNQTRVVPTSDFELAMSRFRNKLINHSIARDRLVFVERRARVESIAARERVVGGDGVDVVDVPGYDASNTYALNGDFIQVGRGRTNLYYLELQLVSFASNAIVWSNRYEVKQQDTN